MIIRKTHYRYILLGDGRSAINIIIIIPQYIFQFNRNFRVELYGNIILYNIRRYLIISLVNAIIRNTRYLTHRTRIVDPTVYFFRVLVISV